MQPLSSAVRRTYLIVLSVFFVALIPLVILYAEGWRFSPELGMYKTGGVFITVPYTDVTVTLQGEEIGTTGFLQRTFYIDDLAPATYVIRASREGYYPWERMVVVEPKIVTDTRVLLAPLEIERTQLVLSGTSTGMRIVTSDTLATYRILFATSTTASSTIPVDMQDGVGLFIDGGNLIARWIDEDRPVPSNFCVRPLSCVTEILLERDPNPVLSASFFAGGVLYRIKDSGIFFAEMDARPTPRVVRIDTDPVSDYRIIDGMLIVKEGSAYFHLDL